MTRTHHSAAHHTRRSTAHHPDRGGLADQPLALPRRMRLGTTPVRLRRVRLAAAALIPALLLAGCGPAPTPSPTPTVYTCTPEAGGDPYPCTADEHAAMVALDALYDEAETVYRRHMTEVFRLSSHWELAQVTPEIEATAAGPYLELLTQLVAENRADRIERISGEPEITWVKRLPDKSLGGSIVALWTCMDGSQRIAMTADAPNGKPGIVAQARVYFRRVDGALKVWESETKLVESC